MAKLLEGDDFDIVQSQQKEIKDKNLESHVNYMKFYNLWRDYDMITAILANTGLII